MLEGNIPSPIRPPQGCKFHTRCYMKCDKCDRVPPPLVEVEPGHFVACHRLEQKLDKDGNYLFELPKMVKKTAKVDGVKVDPNVQSEELVVEPVGEHVEAVMDPTPEAAPTKNEPADQNAQD